MDNFVRQAVPEGCSELLLLGAKGAVICFSWAGGCNSSRQYDRRQPQSARRTRTATPGTTAHFSGSILQKTRTVSFPGALYSRGPDRLYVKR